MRIRYLVTRLGCSILLGLSMAGCQTQSGDSVIEAVPYFEHSTVVSWVDPPNELVNSANDMKELITGNPDRVDRFLGMTPFEDNPNHWQFDVHQGSHSFSRVHWHHKDISGSQIEAMIIDYDTQGRPVSIDFPGKISGPILYDYISRLPSPSRRTYFTKDGHPEHVYYYRDQYGNFMGKRKGSYDKSVESGDVSYRNQGEKFLVTYGGRLPMNKANSPSDGEYADVLWRYDVRSVSPYAYPEYARIITRSVEGSTNTEKVMEIHSSPIDSWSGGDFSGRTLKITHENGGIKEEETKRYQEGLRVAESQESGSESVSIVYSHYKHDDKGNWISRDVTTHRTGLPTKTTQETRRITYR